MSTSGTTSFAPDLTDTNPRIYYVYAHTKPNGTVFYVGKGKGRRAKSSKGRNRHWKSVVAKHGGFTVCKLADELTELAAIDLEAELIAYFRSFGPLANILDRGDVAPSTHPDVRAALSRALTGRVVSEATKEKLRARVVSQETRDKMRVVALNRVVSESTRQKISASNRGRSHSEETRAKISAANKGRGAGVPLSPERRAAAAANNPWRGKLRPEHSALLKSRAVFSGDRNPFFGKGDLQRGKLNRMAVKVAGVHPLHGSAVWDTMQDAANALGVSLQAVAQAVKKQHRSKGWCLERVG